MNLRDTMRLRVLDFLRVFPMITRGTLASGCGGQGRPTLPAPVNAPASHVDALAVYPPVLYMDPTLPLTYGVAAEYGEALCPAGDEACRGELNALLKAPPCDVSGGCEAIALSRSGGELTG